MSLRVVFTDCGSFIFSIQNATAQAALQAAQQVVMGNGEEANSRTTLRVIVENLVYPVTIEVLHQVRTLYCKVPKFLDTPQKFKLRGSCIV